MQKLNIKKSKYNYLFSFLFIFNYYPLIFGATWYSDAVGGNPNDLSKWWSKSNGTGMHPTSFMDSSDIFYLKNGHTFTTINTWNIGGTLQVYGELSVNHTNRIKALVIYTNGLVIGNAQTSIFSTSKGGLFSIKNGGKYIFKHATPNNCLTLFAGTETFGVSSVLEFQDFEKINGAFSNCLANSSSKIGTVIWNIQEGNFAYNLNGNSNIDRTIAGDLNIIKTGSFGSLTWCNSKEVAKFTVEGNYLQSGGRFYIQRSSIGSDSCTLVVQKDFTLNEGIFDLGFSENFNASLELNGDLTMNNGKLYRSCLHPKNNTTIDFKGVKEQVFTYISGEFDTKNIGLNILGGACLTLNSNINIEYSLRVVYGGTLKIRANGQKVG